MARTIGTYRLEVTGAPAYFARAGIPQTPADLANHTCLHHRYPTSGKLQRWPFAGAEVAGASSTIEPLVALAEQGLGLVCVPDFAIRRQLASGSLATVLSEHIDHKGVFRAVWPSSRFVSPKLRVFIDYLAQNLFAPPPPAAG